MKLGLSRKHAQLLARLDTPRKIQDYLHTVPINHELTGETCRAVAGALHAKKIHCIEGAFIAACALWMQGKPPLLMDMQAAGDDDHVITVFRQGRYWGAISKSNHLCLRWRDPVYRTLRELAMSYFHEYETKGRKSLRTYSKPFDLRRRKPSEWVAAMDSCWDLAWDLDQSRHYRLVTPRQIRILRKRDSFERSLGDFVQYPRPRAKK
jgi:hypothetical protein